MALNDPAGLLSAWEAAAAVSDVARGAALVHRAGAADRLDDALDLPVGQTATIAAQLHAEAFGDTVDGVVQCPGCGQGLDLTVPLHEVASAEPGDVATVPDRDSRRTLRVRAPTTRDLLAVRHATDPASALLSRCVRDEHDLPVDPAGLTDEVRDRLDAAADALAGAAGIVIRTSCPDCGTDVAAPLDLPALLWQRVATAAPALLAEVAELAGAYGWSEAEVLALTPARRRAYLSLARGGPR